MGLSIGKAILLFVIVFMGYTIQTISGFGSMIFALPLSLMVVDRLEILPVFLVLSIFQSFSVAYKGRQFIIKKEFNTMILLAIMGLPLGILIGDLIPVMVMNILLGIFIIINSLHSLIKIIRKQNEPELVLSKYHGIYPFLSGFMQAAYGVGGPLIATYMDKVTDDKNVYRSMMCLFWCLLNPIIIIGYITRGEINSSHFGMFLLLIPAIGLALFVGNKIIDHISKRKFQIFVHSLLIIIGCTLFF